MYFDKCKTKKEISELIAEYFRSPDRFVNWSAYKYAGRNYQDVQRERDQKVYDDAWNRIRIIELGLDFGDLEYNDKPRKGLRDIEKWGMQDESGITPEQKTKKKNLPRGELARRIEEAWRALKKIYPKSKTFEPRNIASNIKELYPDDPRPTTKNIGGCKVYRILARLPEKSVR